MGFDTEVDIVRVSAERAGHLFEFPESFLDILRQKPSRQPAVSKSRGSFHCGFCPPSDPEGWMWLLARLRADLRIPKGDKVADWTSASGSGRPRRSSRENTKFSESIESYAVKSPTIISGPMKTIWTSQPSSYKGCRTPPGMQFALQ